MEELDGDKVKVRACRTGSVKVAESDGAAEKPRLDDLVRDSRQRSEPARGDWLPATAAERVGGACSDPDLVPTRLEVDRAKDEWVEPEVDPDQWRAANDRTECRARDPETPARDKAKVRAKVKVKAPLCEEARDESP